MSPDPDVSLDQFHRLIELAYEGPLEPRPWETFLHELRRISGDRAAAITLHHPNDGGMDAYVMADDPDDLIDWNQAERIYVARHMESDPLRTDRVAPGQIVIIDAFKVDPAYAEFLRACQIAYTLRMGFAEPGGMRCWLDVIRRDAQRPFGQREQEFFRKRLPHLERALRLYAALMRTEAEKSLYEETIDHFVLGGLLLNGRSEVIHCNSAASAILAARPDIRIRNRKIVLLESKAQRALDDALAAVAGGCGVRGQTPHGRLIRIGSRPDAMLGLLVRPVPLMPYYQSEQAPHVVVYISDLARNLDAFQPSNNMSHGLIAELFGLTRQQARLALLMADGRTLAEAATEMGIGERTARNYSIDIYQRMGIKGQTDLVRIVYRSFALLR